MFVQLEKNKEDRIACCRRIMENVSQCDIGVYLSHVALIGTIAPLTSCVAGPTAWGKCLSPLEPKLTVKKTMLLIAFTCKIFDHSIAQGCYGNCEVYGGIL